FADENQLQLHLYFPRDRNNAVAFHNFMQQLIIARLQLLPNLRQLLPQLEIGTLVQRRIAQPRAAQLEIRNLAHDAKRITTKRLNELHRTWAKERRGFV